MLGDTHGKRSCSRFFIILVATALLSVLLPGTLFSQVWDDTIQETEIEVIETGDPEDVMMEMAPTPTSTPTANPAGTQTPTPTPTPVATATGVYPSEDSFCGDKEVENYMNLEDCDDGMHCIPPGGIPDDLVAMNQLWGCTRVKDCADHYPDTPLDDLKCQPIGGDGCNENCKYEFCGDGVVQPLLPGAPEECDPGSYCHDKSTSPWTILYDEPCNHFTGCNHLGAPGDYSCVVVGKDGCTENCKFSVCGNNIIESGEKCDDGNIIDGDGCSSTCQGEFECCFCKYWEEARCANLNGSEVAVESIQDPEKVCTGCEYSPPISEEKPLKSKEDACERLYLPVGKSKLHDCDWNKDQEKCVSRYRTKCSDWMGEAEQAGCDVTDVVTDSFPLEPEDFSFCKSPIKIERFGHSNTWHCLSIAENASDCLECVESPCKLEIHYWGCLTFALAEEIKQMIKKIQADLQPGDEVIITAHTALVSEKCSSPLTVVVFYDSYQFKFFPCSDMGKVPGNYCGKTGDFAYCLDKPGDTKPTKMYCCPMDKEIDGWKNKFQKELC
jgi:cysteine-rich repeat protein